MFKALRHISRSVIQQGRKPTLLPRTMSSTAQYDFETLKVTSPSEYVKHVEMNRPDKRNAMNTAFWKEITDCFTKLAVDEECRVVILSGSGKMFTAGLDIQENEIFALFMSDMDVGRKAFAVKQNLRTLQDAFTVIEKCCKPVIAAVHNGCIGGGIDMIAACDIRYCTQDAWFQIKEVDLGLAADLGTLQRFPKIIGNDSLCRELVYSARKFHADEAKDIGFIGQVYPDKEKMLAASIELSKAIASKSPIAVQGSKQNLVYSRDHSVSAGLDYMVAWNASMLQSEDVKNAMVAMMQREEPVFSKL